MNRRQLLLGSTAVVASAALPAIPEAVPSGKVWMRINPALDLDLYDIYLACVRNYAMALEVPLEYLTPAPRGVFKSALLAASYDTDPTIT